jgi:hypothetical protein
VIPPVICRLPASVAGATSVDKLVAGVLIAWALWAAWAAVAGDERRLWMLAVSSMAFQAGHLAEHFLQLGGLALTTSEPTVTPWGRSVVIGLAWVWDGDARLGLEMMHFLGDSIFVSGVVAWLRLTGTGVAAMVAQGAHMAEHVALGVTVVTLGTPYGLTVIGPAWQRVLVHWTLNFTGSACWASAIWRWHGRDLGSGVGVAHAG